MLVSFELSMPNNNSWNGKWSGEGRCYARVRNLTKKQAQRVLLKDSYYYSFGDGWGACVAVKQVDANESRKIRKKSQGFCGYDWMIDEIQNDGKITGRWE